MELEYTLIPHGLHTVGAAPSIAERAEQTHGDRRGLARPCGSSRPADGRASCAGKTIEAAIAIERSLRLKDSTRDRLWSRP